MSYDRSEKNISPSGGVHDILKDFIGINEEIIRVIDKKLSDSDGLKRNMSILVGK